ncbi:MAG: hypothetical protein E7281_08170 [Lachnospiraceae bacterium]|nr:hypothetical protein [Lachnospiraceae bacterium]
MREKTKPERQENKKRDSIVKTKMIIAFTSVIEILFMILELYFMLKVENAIPMIIVIAICMAVVLFVLVTEAIELSQRNKEKDRQEFEDLYKAQKASYIALKKYFDEIADRLNIIEESADYREEIINAQKAVAKVTINRSKENTDALMNSNDELIKHIFGFQEKLQENNDELIRQNEEMLLKTKEELLQQTKNDIESSNSGMQNQFEMLQSKLQQMQQEINALDNKVATPVVMPAMPQEPVAAPVMAEEPVVEEAPVEEVAAEEPVVEEVPVEVAAAEMVEEPAADIEESVSDDDISDDDVAAMLESLQADTENMAAEEESQTDEVDDMSTEDIDAMLASLREEPVVEEAPAEEIAADEAVVEEPPVEEPAAEEPAEDPLAAFDTSDPNKQLSPDEIAAMFAATSGDAAPAVEPEVEEASAEEVAVEEPVAEEPVEEAPVEEPAEDPLAALDTSDPNKQLSPDEIAAMFAAASGDAPAEEPKEEKPPMPELSDDPNKQLSPEEIAALFANV